MMIHHQLFSPKIPLEEHIRYFLLLKISLHTMEEICGWLHPYPFIFASTPSLYNALTTTVTGWFFRAAPSI